MALTNILLLLILIVLVRLLFNINILSSNLKGWLTDVNDSVIDVESAIIDNNR